jgi:branched-chain amino acid transport system substrate-binding protein
MNRQRHGLAGALLSLALVLAACSNDPGDSSDDPFRVLAVLPLTGPLTAQAKMGEHGLRAAVDELNADDGIGGREIELEVVDDKLDPTEAVTLLQQQINSSEPPDLVIGGITSNETLAMLPALTSAKILSAAVSSDLAMNDPEKYPYHFGLQATSDQAYPRILERALDRGVEKLGFIAANDAFGTYNQTAIEKAAAGTGIEVVTETYDVTATDLTAPLDALRGEDPDLVVMSGFGPLVGYLLDARQKLGWDVPVIGDVGLSGSNPGTLVDAEALQGVEIQTFTLPSRAHEEEWPASAKPMMQAVKEQGEITQIITLSSLPYDALRLLAVAAEQAGSTEPDDLAHTLESLEAPDEVPWTSYREYGYTADNHFPVTSDEDYVFVEATPLVNGLFE